MLTYIFIGITVIISLLAFNNPQLKQKLLLNPYLASRGQYYRLFTSGFVHADFMHLFFNMWALYLFGQTVESTFDGLYGNQAAFFYILLYFGGIIFANLPSYFKEKNNPNYNSLGASGGVTSVVFASVLIYPLMKLMIFPIPIPMPAYVFALVYVGYSIYMDKRQSDNVNHMAHLFGGLWGFIIMGILQPNIFGQFFSQIYASLQ